MKIVIYKNVDETESIIEEDVPIDTNTTTSFKTKISSYHNFNITSSFKTNYGQLTPSRVQTFKSRTEKMR